MTGGTLEKTELQVGFIPILCATPLMLAHASGLFDQRGLTVRLYSPSGWGGVKELLAYEKLDAAHVLAPMPLAAHLGIDGKPGDAVLNAIQNTNGQAITLHQRHRDKRHPSQFRGLTFGVPYAYSMHYYLLCDHLAAHGVDPLRDVTILEVAPPAMPAYLEQGWVDGVLAPEPFNQIPVNRGIGFLHRLSKELWDGHPCCGFAATRTLVETCPNTHRALVDAVLEAESVLHHANDAQRHEIAHLISGPGYLGLDDADVAEQVLTGRFADGLGEEHHVPDRIDFRPHPHPDSGAWMVSQMQRWGQLPHAVDIRRVVATVFQPVDDQPGDEQRSDAPNPVPPGFDASDPFGAMRAQPFSAFPDQPPPPDGTDAPALDDGARDDGARDDGRSSIEAMQALVDPLVRAVGGDLHVAFPALDHPPVVGELSRLLDRLVRNGRFLRDRLQDQERRVRRAKAIAESQLGERVKELRCLYSIARLLQSAADPLDVLAEVTQTLPSGWLDPEHTVARVRLEGQEHVSSPAEVRVPLAAAPIVVDGAPVGEIAIGSWATDEDSQACLPEERELLEAVASTVAAAVERREAERRYEDLYQRSPDGLLSVDAKTGLVLACNDTACEKTGFPRGEIVGHPILDRYHPSCLDDAKEAFEGFVRTGSVLDAELRLRRKDGGFLDVSLQATAVRDAEGRIVQSRSSWRDISKRKSLERTLDEHEVRLRSLLETMPLGWAEHELVRDDDGAICDFRWTDINRAYSEMTGQSAEDCLGHRFLEVVPDGRDHSPDMVALYGEVVTEQRGREFELYFAPYERWYRVFAFPTGPNHFGVLFLDTTAERQAQETIEAANVQLRQTNEELEQFAYVASHDLQEPLRMVASYTELLAARYEGQLDAKADRYIHHAVSGAKRMQTLIHDLLHYSRAGRLELHPEPVALGELVASVLDDQRATIDERGAEVSVSPLPEVWADPARMRQVLQNLVSNALKFTRDEPPRLDIAGGQDGDEVWISVTDHGIGIAPEHQRAVFDIFHRVHHRDAFTGTGIGLAIVKRVVERHGGTVSVTSSEGAGATFTVRLPQTSPGSPSADPRPAS